MKKFKQHPNHCSDKIRPMTVEEVFNLKPIIAEEPLPSEFFNPPITAYLTTSQNEKLEPKIITELLQKGEDKLYWKLSISLNREEMAYSPHLLGQCSHSTQ